MKKLEVEGCKEYFQKTMSSVDHIDGCFLEAGFGHGQSARTIVDLMNKNEIKKRNIWLCDSFEGFPEPTIHDESPRNPKKGEWKVSPYPAFQIKKSIDTEVKVIKGYFEDTIPSKYTGGQIAILHLDCDLYNSYKVCLEGLYDKVQPGGLILFDEYRSPVQLRNYPGASIAIDEFFKNRQINAEICMAEWTKVQKFYMLKPE